MKPTRSLRRFLTAGLAGSALSSAPVHALTYYWDNTSPIGTAGFGTAGGTWGTDAFWSASSAGTDSSGIASPLISDDLNFGFTATGLAAGTVSVTGTQSAKSLTFASGSGAILLSGGTVNLAAAATITVDNSAGATIASSLTGAATSFTKTGTGTLKLSSTSNSYTGTTTISAGTLALGESNVIPNTSRLVMAPGSTATFDLNGKNETVLGFTNSGAGAGTRVIDNTAASTSSTLTVGGGFFAGNIRNTGSGATLALIFSGTGGDLVLTGNNSYSGGTTLNGGDRLFVAGSSALPTTGAVQVNSGGTLAFNVGGTYNQSITLASGANLSVRQSSTFGNLTLPTAGSVIFNNDDTTTVALDLGGSVALTGDLTVQVGGNRVTSNPVGAVTLSGNISGGFGLTKTQTGSLILSNTANSYSGSTTINGGVLSVATLAPNGSNSGIGSGSDLTLNGGTLRYTGSNSGTETLNTQFNRAISIGVNGGTIDVAGSGFLFSNSTLTGSGTLSVIDSSGDTNNRQLLYTGNSPLFTGNVEVGNGTANSGWLQIRSNAASPLGSAIVTVKTGGIFSTDKGSTTPTTLANNIVLDGGVLASQSIATSYNGTITANSGKTSFLQTQNASSNLVLGGSLLGSGTLQKDSGTASVELRGNNSGFSGTYSHTVAGSTIFYTGSSASAAAAWSLGHADARFLAGGSSQTYHLGSLSGTTGVLQNLSAASGNSTFQIGALNTSTSFGGTIADNGGTVAITKVGSGTLTLSGTSNTFSGETTIKAGTLKLNAANTIGTSSKITVGDAGSSGAVLDVTTAGLTVGSGATLAGIGSVTGTGQTVTINGTHAVGNAGTAGGVGTQTVTAATLAYGAGSIFEWDINTASGNYDKVALTGARTVDSTAIFKVVSSTVFTDSFWDTTRNWTDIFGASNFGFNLANFQFVANGSTVTASSFASEGSFSITGSGTTLTWTAIPEPTSALAGLLLGAGLLRRRRKGNVAC